jgi:ubiquinone biosynthesis protein UbiJ
MAEWDLTTELKHSRNDSALPHGFETPRDQGRSAGNGPVPAPTHAMVIESIQRLAGRIEEAEQHTAETLRPLAEKVSVLSERIEEVGSRSNVSTAPMERALMRLTERLERLEAEKGGKGAGRRGFFSR